MQQTRIGKIASERTQAEMQEKKTKETTDANFKKDVLDSDFVLNNQHNWDFIYEKKEEGR